MSTEHDQDYSALKTHGRSSWAVGIGIMAGLVFVPAAVYLGPMIVTFVRLSWHIAQTRNQLLHKTDHAAVLDACQKIMRLPELQTDDFVEINDSRIPAVIRDLGPRGILIEKDHVSVEFCGGFHHQGFDAYPIGAARPDYGPDRPGVMHREIIPGLWYYECD